MPSQLYITVPRSLEVGCISQTVFYLDVSFHLLRY